MIVVGLIALGLGLMSLGQWAMVGVIEGSRSLLLLLGIWMELLLAVLLLLRTRESVNLLNLVLDAVRRLVSQWLNRLLQ